MRGYLRKKEFPGGQQFVKNVPSSVPYMRSDMVLKYMELRPENADENDEDHDGADKADKNAPEPGPFSKARATLFDFSRSVLDAPDPADKDRGQECPDGKCTNAEKKRHIRQEIRSVGQFFR